MVLPQEDLIRNVRESVRTLTDSKPHLQFYCDDKCILRFLRARGMDPKKASEMLSAAIKWREEKKMHEITYPDVAGYMKTGKIILGPEFSKCGRPVMIMRTRMEDAPKDWEQNIKHFAYQMEMAARVADEKSTDGKVVVLIDFTGWTMAKSAPLKVSLAVLKILQNYYPERLWQCVWWHAPVLFNTAYKLIKPFVDPVTSKKFLMLPKGSKDSQERLNEIVETSVLDKTLGGSKEDMYDIEVYKRRYLDMEETYKQEMETFAEQQASAMPPEQLQAEPQAVAVQA